MDRPVLLADRLSALERYESAVPEKEAVHQMRVAARRLRAALRVLQLRGLDPPVKQLQDALGEVRDLQLQTNWLRGRDAVLCRERGARLRTAEQKLSSQLRRWRSRTLPALLAAAGDPFTPSSRRVSKMLRKRLDRLEERLEEARSRLTPKALHRARISVKQVRYILDVVGDAVPRRASGLDADLRTLQASMGELHDVDVRIGLVKKNPKLLRDQREARAQLAKIIAAQLGRWRKKKVAARARKAL
jgi:CHAD domain-containing protein